MAPAWPRRSRRTGARDPRANRARQNAGALAPRRTRAIRRSSAHGVGRGGGEDGRGGRAAQVVREKRHGFALPGACGLVHDHLEAREFVPDVLGRQEVRARREDRRLEHRVLGAIIPDEFTAHTAVHYVRLDAGPRGRGVERPHFELTPRASRIDDDSVYHLRRTGRKLDVPDGPLGEEHHVIRQVDDRYAGRLDVLKRDRKSTRLNSSHITISYAVFCLKKKKKNKKETNSKCKR